MIRTMDGGFLTKIANREDVRPYMGGEGVLDLDPIIGDPVNFAFVDDDLEGGYVFCMLYDGVYEGHTIFPPSAPYRPKVRLIRSCFNYMFTATDCTEIVTKIPDTHEGASRMADMLHFLPGFSRENAWGHGVGVAYRNLPLDRWATTCSTAEEQGHMFHSMLEQAKAAAGSELPVHPDDVIHDRMVGACIHMIRAGNLEKGVRAYNQWALFAGYGIISIVSQQPVVVDVQDALIGITLGELEVLKCR